MTQKRYASATVLLYVIAALLAGFYASRGLPEGSAGTYNCTFDRMPGEFTVTGAELDRATMHVTVAQGERVLMLRRSYMGACELVDE